MHFDLYDNRDGIVQYIEEQESYTIAATNLPDIYKRYLDKYTDKKYVKIAVGMHPELSVEYKRQLPIFKQMVNTTRFIGEVGLDYSNADGNDQINQIDIFKKYWDI